MFFTTFSTKIMILNYSNVHFFDFLMYFCAFFIDLLYFLLHFPKLVANTFNDVFAYILGRFQFGSRNTFFLVLFYFCLHLFWFYCIFWYIFPPVIIFFLTFSFFRSATAIVHFCWAWFCGCEIHFFWFYCIFGYIYCWFIVYFDTFFLPLLYLSLHFFF